MRRWTNVSSGSVGVILPQNGWKAGDGHKKKLLALGNFFRGADYRNTDILGSKFLY